MGNHLLSLLDDWDQTKDQGAWVLGTVYKTEGSAYRKAGAMMLIDGSGRRLGLLSGGCLEADIARNAAKVMASGRPATVVYDGADEDDLSFRLGIGCGGKVFIMLQPLSPVADLDLAAMAEALRNRRSGLYHQRLPQGDGPAEAWFEERATVPPGPARLENRDGATWLVTPIIPQPHLLVIGGGIDAMPVVEMAKILGWQVSLADPRPANARRDNFLSADHILRDLGEGMVAHARSHRIDAAVLMTHNLALDAQALASLTRVDLKHAALLGPRHRFIQVLARAGLSEAALPWPVSGPAGWPVGGHLPESIALSILAECHAALHLSIERPALKAVLG